MKEIDFMGNLFADIHYAGEHGEFVPGMAEAFYTGLAGIGIVLMRCIRCMEMKMQKVQSIFFQRHIPYLKSPAQR